MSQHFIISVVFRVEWGMRDGNGVNGVRIGRTLLKSTYLLHEIFEYTISGTAQPKICDMFVVYEIMNYVIVRIHVCSSI